MVVMTSCALHVQRQKLTELSPNVRCHEHAVVQMPSPKPEYQATISLPFESTARPADLNVNVDKGNAR